MRFEFLTVCTRQISNKEEFLQRLIEALQSAWDENVEEYNLNDLSTEQATSMLNVSLRRDISRDDEATDIEQIIYSFDLTFDVDMREFLESNRIDSNYIRNIVRQFAVNLNEDVDIRHVSKFYDELLLEQNLLLMRPIFEIEMNLRKAIAIIYFSAYRDDLYNVLRNDLVTLRKEDKNETRMREFIENEFFFLDFSQYAALNQFPKPKTVEEILEILQGSDSFDGFREKLSLPIKDDNDSDFLLSIQSQLESHQKLRNCLAHNRASSVTIRKNHETAKTTLDNVFDEFFKRFVLE